MERSLEGKVAVVAGGTRGAGRGISVELGAAGATVYVTGRSSRSGLSPIGRPETIEETAEMVEEQGGRGIAVRVYHSLPEEVESLFERVEEEQGGRCRSSMPTKPWTKLIELPLPSRLTCSCTGTL